MYTIFVKESGVERMECLEWDWRIHDRLPKEQKNYTDMKKKIDDFVAKKRKERNDKVRRGGVSDSVTVPGVPSVEELGNDGLLLEGDSAPNEIPAMPGAKKGSGKGRSKSRERKETLNRGKSWTSDNGTGHSPSGYRYSRDKSRMTPRGSRQKP